MPGCWLSLTAASDVNLPLSKATAIDEFEAALHHAGAVVGRHVPDVLISSLGVDTFEHNPISHFRLRTPDYLRIGEIFAGFKIPILFVMESGYMVGEIGINAVNVLLGFEGRA